MIKHLILIISLFGSLSLLAQSPVNFKYSSEKLSDHTYEIRITAELMEPWYIYSSATPDEGPVPTNVKFVKNPLIQLEGGITEKGELLKKYESAFELEVLYFKNRVNFVQVVKKKGKVKTNLSGSITYMVCNEEKCLPERTDKFTVELN